MVDRQDQIAGLIRGETGKPEGEALTELVVSVDLIHFYANEARRHLRPRRVGTGWLLWKRAWVERVPVGVVGAITPWNYPLIIVVDAVAASVAAGNAVVLKPSEFTPLTALLLRDVMVEAGFPEDLVAVVTGDGQAGEALVGGGVDHVLFTGSTATGRKVLQTAVSSLTPVTLELGGKDVAMVLADADLERSARGVVFGAMFNAGQTCLSVERALVERSVFDGFVERVVELTSGLSVGTGPNSDVGPMVTGQQVYKVEEQIEDAVRRGAKVRCGGTRHPDNARIFLPTVVVDVNAGMTVVSEETFGPVLAILPVDDEDHAVRVANELGYGLFASVWTGDRARGLDVGRRLEVGGFSVNDVLSHYAVPGLPVGGVKMSGFGRRRGTYSLDQLTHPRTVLVDRIGLRSEPWWFPYSAGGTRLFRALLHWRGYRGMRGLFRAARSFLGGQAHRR